MLSNNSRKNIGRNIRIRVIWQSASNGWLTLGAPRLGWGHSFVIGRSINQSRIFPATKFFILLRQLSNALFCCRVALTCWTISWFCLCIPSFCCRISVMIWYIICIIYFGETCSASPLTASISSSDSPARSVSILSIAFASLIIFAFALTFSVGFLSLVDIFLALLALASSLLIVVSFFSLPNCRDSLLKVWIYTIWNDMRFRGSVLFLQDMFCRYCRYTNVSFPYKVYEGFLREVQILPSGVRRISGGGCITE